MSNVVPFPDRKIELSSEIKEYTARRLSCGCGSDTWLIMDDALECADCGYTVVAESLDTLMDELEASEYCEG